MASSTPDYDALANQYGLSISEAPLSAAKPNYDGLAKQFGLAISSKPPGPDYDALAKQHGLTISEIPPAPPPPLPPELASPRPSLAELKAEGKLNAPELPPSDGPTMRAAQPGAIDYLRRAVFGGPAGETSLGRAFPSMSGATISDTATTDLPLVRLDELVPSEEQVGNANLAPDLVPGAIPNPLATPASRAATRGVLQSASELTKPVNAEIVAATEGLGALTPATGYASVLGKGINAALGLYFANEMRKGATDAARQAWERHQAGDDEEAARLLGYGSLSALMAALGITHAVRSVPGILRTKVPKPALTPEVLPPEAQPEPEPLSATPPPTVDVGQEIPPPPAPETPTSSPAEPPTEKSVTPEATPALKPASVDRVSPATPNPPTAAVPTAPESPETIAIQLQQLSAGQRKAVMFPQGTPPPDTYPEGTAVTSDAFGNTYVFRPDLTSRSAIKRAAKKNQLPTILGSAELGMGAPDKSQLPPDAPVVTSHAADGTEVQSTATDGQTLPATIAATQAVTPPGGSVSIQPAAQTIAERQETPPAAPAPPPAPSQDLGAPQPIEQPPAPSQTGLDQAGGDLTAPMNLEHTNQAEEVHHPEIIGVTETRKPLQEMDPEELDRVIEQRTAEEKNLVFALFGKEGGQKYLRLQRIANGISDRADAAATEIQDIEASLTPAQRDKLFGIGEPDEHDIELARSIRNTLGRLDLESPEALGNSLQWAVSRFDPKNPIANPEAYAQLRYAARFAREQGWDTNHVSHAALRAAAHRFSDPEDALFILSKFFRVPKSSGVSKPAPKELPAAPQPARDLATPWSIEPVSAIAMPAAQVRPSAADLAAPESVEGLSPTPGAQTPKHPPAEPASADLAAPQDIERAETIEKPEASQGEHHVEIQDSVRTTSGEPLARELSERGARAGEPGIARAPRGSRGREGSGHPAPATGEGPGVPSGARTGEPGVGDTADAVNNNPNFPPRAGTVSSTRFEHDYRIPDGRVISGSPEIRARNNIAAIELLRQLEQENRPATVEEQQILAGYVGWGAVPQLFAGATPEWLSLQQRLRSLISEQEYEEARRSTTNAHYTDDVYVDAIWKAMQHMGANAGMVWGEPSVGIGTFFGRQPADLLEGARRIGIEKDALTAALAKYLYPDSGIDHKPFEESELPEEYFDGFVGNVPFGDFGVHDPAFKNRKYLTSPIHNYFFAKSLEYTRPGGVIAFITSRYTMDGYDKSHQQFRDYIASKADLLGAVRLPSYAMKAGGTHVITDILFLRKRLPGAAPPGEAWSNTANRLLRSEHLGYSLNVPTNEYFHNHPENILGEERLERGQFTNADYTVKGAVAAESLDATLQRTLPQHGFQDYQADRKSSKVAIRDLSTSEEAKKLGGLFFDEKGDLYRKTSKGSAERVEVPATVEERIRGQLRIRDLSQQLIAHEQADDSEEALDKQRGELNRVYDEFVKTYGPLSNRQNIAAMLGDPDAPVLVALERKYDPKGKTAEKAPIFQRRAFHAIRKIESASDAKEALYIALNDTGRVDWARMQELTGQGPEELQGELKGIVYQDPRTKEWELAEEYLSGAVRSKLKEAQRYAKVEPQFQENVSALQQVLPEDIPPSQISALPGVTWVPTEIYSEFARDVLSSAEAPQVNYIGGEWHIARTGSRSASKWGTAHVSAETILKDTLNLRKVKVYDEDGRIDKQATLAARDKQKQLADYFEKWLFADTERANQVTYLYNDLINDLRLRVYDGSHLTLPEMSRAFLRSGDLEPYQKAAVWRQIAQRNVLLAHAVGSGKTFDAIAGAMELKRLGLIKRPMFVVPNSTLTGWQQQFAMLYPQKRVLVFSEADLEKLKRQRVFAQIQLGDWDAVVVPHSSFQFIPVGDELFNEHFARKARELEESIKDAAEAGADTRLIKRMEKAKEKLLTQMQERRNNERKDLTVSWEQMGIDQLYLDEAHEYRKLGFSTKQQNVPGIDPNGNQKTFDLKMKVDWTQRHGRGVTFTTGTPVMNTMGELYNVMQYLIPQELAARGLGRFDEWSANFGRTKDVFEPKPEGGGYQVKSRYAEFVNLQDLGQLFRSFADVLTSDMLTIERPSFFGGSRRSIVTELTEAQQGMMNDLQARAAGIRADPRGALPDNMAALYTDAQLMALDARMLDENAPDEPGNRLNQAANEIHRLWEESGGTKGAQLIFLDSGKPASERTKTKKATLRPRSNFSAYDDLISKLKQRGIPAHEIAHIYQAKTKAERAKLFQDVNDGRIRVLIGSFAKMGTGVNVQERVYGMHFLTLPHWPSLLEQAEGRGIRQGNVHKQVHSVYYITKGSLDELKFAGVSRKLKAFNQFMQGRSTLRKMEDVDEMAPNLDQFTAEASGDPRVKRKLEVDNELLRLSELQSAYRDERWQNQRELNGIPNRTANAEKAIRVYESAIATRDGTGRIWQFGKKSIQGDGLQKAAAQALETLLKTAKPGATIGSAWGLPVTAAANGVDVAGHHVNAGYTEVKAPNGVTQYVLSGVGTFTRIENYIKNIEGEITSKQDLIDRAQRDGVALREALEQPWPYKDEFDKLQKEQHDLFVALGGNKSDAGAQMLDDDEDLKDESVEAAEPEDSEEENENGGRLTGGGPVTLGGGLGGLQPAYELAEAATRQFVREEVIPKVASLLQGSRDLVDTIVRWIDPRRGVPIGTLDAIYRMKGGRDAADYLLSRQLDKWGDRVGRMSQDDMVNFIDRMKTGRPQVDPELQQLAGFLRRMDDELFNEVEQYKPSLEYLENHFRVLWRLIPGSPEAKGDVKALFRRVFSSRRPLGGRRGFLKEHKLADMTEGLERGGVPYTYNPIDMFKAHYSDAMKFITAQRLWDEFQKMGVRKFVPLGKPGPEGYTRLDDRIARVYFPVKEGMVHSGEWWVEQGAHRLLKNFLSRDLVREQAFGRFLMAVKNGTTAIELSISPFHAVFEANEAIGSQIGIGLRQIWNLGVRKGDPRAIGAGLRTLATAPGAAVAAARLGAQAKEAFGNFDEFSKTPAGQAWLKENATVQQDVQDLFHGGLKIGQHEDYKLRTARTFQEYLNSAGPENPGHYVSAAVRSIPALNQWIMKPLFEVYIPNLKLGFALKEYNLAKSEYSDRLASGEMTREQLARQIVDSVENRFGEMNFDNLFWDRTFKTFAQLLFRSVTWKLGNLRANVGALTGEWAEMAEAFKNKRIPRLHPNTAWLLGMTLWTCILGATIHTLAGLIAGRRLKDALPAHLKDFVFPYIDAAAEIRVAIPTYWRDIVHLVHSPLDYVKTSLSGEIGRMADIWENKDFYGNEIWNADDPLPDKVLEGIRHLFPLPFSVSSARQAKQQGGSEAARVAGYLGFTKAPRYIEQTDAEQLASQYTAQHRETGARTHRDAEAAQAVAAIRNIYRRGGNPEQEIRSAIDKGLISARDVPKIRTQARRSPLETAIQRLPLAEALNVYNVATADERKQISMTVRRKVIAARTQPKAWTPRAEALAAKYFGIRPVRPRAPLADFAMPAAIQ